MPVNLSYPKPRSSQIKMFEIARTDTVASIKAWLPKDALVVGVYVLGDDASDSGGAATISSGYSPVGTDILASFSVKTQGVGYFTAGASLETRPTKLTTDKPVYGSYVEAGAASTTGGPWTVKIEYIVTGNGETI